jgi:sugar (pentulose or hexulose) kinase
LRWLRETFASDATFDELIESVSGIAPGAEGIRFYPFLDGAGRAPHYLPGATGAFIGIVSGHTRGHVVRALLEGVAYQYPPAMTIAGAGAGATVRPPIATGDGEARSALWNQIKADVLGVPLRVPRVVELAAAGSAILAGVAGRVFADAAAGVRALVHWDRRFDPDPASHAVYEELRAEYERVFKLITSDTHDKESNR